MEIIYTNNAPEPIWPYSQAIKFDKFIFCSWQIWIDPKTWKLVEWLENQTIQICENIKNILKQAWSDLNKVVKTTIYLENIQDFGKVNEIYWKYFSHKPARSTVEVSKLPLDALVEVEVIAII